MDNPHTYYLSNTIKRFKCWLLDEYLPMVSVPITAKFVSLKGKFKQWWSSIPQISTKWTITFHLNWTHGTQKRPWHISLISARDKTITYENVINCLFPLIIYQYNYEKGLCVFNATMFRNMWAISWDHFGWCVTVETIDLLQVTDNLCYFTLSRAEIKLICHGLFCVPWVQLRWKVIVHFVDICGIDDHHCLNFHVICICLHISGVQQILSYVFVYT
jgi:hypothetical protein